MDGNGKEIWIGWESPPEIVKEPKSWEEVKSELEELILKARFKEPNVEKVGADGLNYLVVTFRRNGKPESYGVIAHTYEEGAKRLYDKIISTRFISY